MVSYYLGIIFGIIVTKLVPDLEYALIIIFASLIMILLDITIFAKQESAE